jgi:hypothetical protein
VSHPPIRPSQPLLSSPLDQGVPGSFAPMVLPTPFPHQVDIYIMTQPLSGKWIHFGTEVTNSSGRLTFPVSSERVLGIGVYPVRMVVR